MKVSGVKVIELNERETDFLLQARIILENLAEQIESTGADDDFVETLNQAAETCRSVAYEKRFDYPLGDGDE